jgi:hypothetical protein
VHGVVHDVPRETEIRADVRDLHQLGQLLERSCWRDTRGGTPAAFLPELREELDKTLVGIVVEEPRCRLLDYVRFVQMLRCFAGALRGRRRQVQRRDQEQRFLGARDNGVRFNLGKPLRGQARALAKLDVGQAVFCAKLSEGLTERRSVVL